MPSVAFTTRLASAQVAISMDGRGRVFDQIVGERWWRTVNYAEMSRQNEQTVCALEGGLGQYWGFSHHQRLHEAVDDRTPAEVHCRERR